MFHNVAHAIAQRPLFTDWEAGWELWQDCRRHLKGVRALALMPDHVHVVSDRDQRDELVEVARAFARWRRWHRGDGGRLWERVPGGDRISGTQHLGRTVRYVHLNPCRARLVRCPVAWPLSTYRAALGLVAQPLIRTARDPMALHARTSADGSTQTDGTPFPDGTLDGTEVTLVGLIGAVSAWRQVPVAQVLAPGRQRRWLLRAVRSLTDWPHDSAAHAIGVHRSQVSRARPLGAADAAVLARLVADDRLPGWIPDDPRLARWRPRPLKRRVAGANLGPTTRWMQMLVAPPG